MSLSIYNSTNVPLQSGQEFSGAYYDNILDYSQINISINCDTGYDLTYYYSQDKINVSYQTTQSILASSETQFYKAIPLERYFKISITATDGDMTNLNVQTIYKLNVNYSVGNGTSSDVNIVSPVNNNGDVKVSDTQIYNLLNTKGTSQLFNGVISAGDKSSTLDISSKKINNLSFYGNQDSNGNILTVLFSNDGTTFYNSQYTYSFNSSSSGDFGFNIQCSTLYVSVSSANACNLILYCDYS
jgi:hypothetical protein